jgi:hypothetical protein
MKQGALADELSSLYCNDDQKTSEENRTGLCNVLLRNVPKLRKTRKNAHLFSKKASVATVFHAI